MNVVGVVLFQIAWTSRSLLQLQHSLPMPLLLCQAPTMHQPLVLPKKPPAPLHAFHCCSITGFGDIPVWCFLFSCPGASPLVSVPGSPYFPFYYLWGLAVSHLSLCVVPGALLTIRPRWHGCVFPLVFKAAGSFQHGNVGNYADKCIHDLSTTLVPGMFYSSLYCCVICTARVGHLFTQTDGL